MGDKVPYSRTVINNYSNTYVRNGSPVSMGTGYQVQNPIAVNNSQKFDITASRDNMNLGKSGEISNSNNNNVGERYNDVEEREIEENKNDNEDNDTNDNNGN